MTSTITIDDNKDHTPLIKRVATASAIGTAAEYYDFFAYSTAVVLFFGHLFFPSSDPLISTLAAFATYAVGFFARPIGGIVFGHIGDKVGRKKALVITILIVGIGTFCIGLLPTYEKIGIWAPILLILIRILQGFGVGGEQQIRDIRQQDLLWSVSEMGDDSWNSRVIGVATSALHAEIDGIEAVLEALTLPDIAIVSITVTEKGYYHHPASGQLNVEHPLIVQDLLTPEQPRSLPGVILAAIKRRRARGLPPFSVMSCDNMPENGHVTRNVVTQLAQRQDPSLA